MTNINLQKGFAMPVIIAIIIFLVLVVGGGYYFTKIQPQTYSTNKDLAGKKELEGGAIINLDGAITQPDNATKEDNGAMMVKYTGTILAGNSSPLLDFTKADYDAAATSDKLVILYFYANWCPICKVEFPKMQEAFNELTVNEVVGFRVNYKDNETDNDEKALAVRFGIPYQHTKVFLKNGKQILKAPDSWDKARYITEVDKAINQ